MAAGDAFRPAEPTAANPLTMRQLRRIRRAVDSAEDASGLQLCVYVGPTEDDPRREAERLLAESGAASEPAVLILVAPLARRFEIVTSPAARRRVSDRSCSLAAASMSASFALGDFVGGICTGVAMIAETAGPADQAPGSEELPDLLSGY